MKLTLGFIGFGHMAQAIAQYLVKQPHYEIYAASPSLAVGITTDGIHTHHDNKAVVQHCQLIILAVKPQVAESVLKQIGHMLPHDSLLISIVAGFTLTSLAVFCNKDQAIIRSMPNLPILVGKGATPLIANTQTTIAHKMTAEKLFQCAGMITWLKHEHEMDYMTALTGSSPAYLFYFLEAIIASGTTFGLSETMLKSLVLQTMEGAIQLAKSSEANLSELIQKVTSKGGTTEAALNVFHHREFNSIITEAIQAASLRATALGNI